MYIYKLNYLKFHWRYTQYPSIEEKTTGAHKKYNMAAFPRKDEGGHFGCGHMGFGLHVREY